MTSYRVGIVGLSWISADPAAAASHPVLGLATPYSHASAYAAVSSASVVAGCDINPDTTRSFAEEWAKTWPELRTYANYREMLAAAQLDVLTVATPDHLHASVVIAAAEAGVRAIFAEKPLATNLADADALIDAVRRHGVVVNVNHTRRWMPSYVAARECVRTGEIGGLVQVTIHYGGSRAMLWRNQSHFLDLICYFAEDDPAWVMAELEPGFEAYGTEYRGDGGRNPDLEPGVNAYVAFDNGVRGFLGGMKRAVAQVSVDLICERGRIHADDQGAMLHVSTDAGVVSRPIVPKGSHAGMQAAVVDLLTALETGRPPQCPPEEARKTVAIIEAILLSQASGNARVPVAAAPTQAAAAATPFVDAARSP
ncbi:MAG: Gfo/Idh/MocA family protein [Thermomicrobiales bacterium]